MKFVKWLDSIGPDDASAVGGKAASLGSLLAGGFNVPPGFCLTANSHRESGEREIAPVVRSELLTAFRELRDGSMARHERDGAAIAFAVRSSATAEDLPDASFAGIYQTFLGICSEDELVDAVLACWTSARSPEALAYLSQRAGIGQSDMAVIVQVLVPADTAGVMFTAHPVTGALNAAAISSSWGLGEAVVAARVEADTFVVRKDPFAVLEEKIGTKKVLIGPGGVETQLDAARQSARSLTRAQLLELADMAVRLEAHYAFPQDVEWAYAGNRLYLLQSRRITTLQEAYYTEALHSWATKLGLQRDADTLWVRGTPLSSLPLSPLYFSEMSRFFTDMFTELVPLEGRKPARRQAFRYYQAWSYINRGFGRDRAPAPTHLFDRAWLPKLKLYLSHPRSLAVWSTARRYYHLYDRVWLPEIARRRPDFMTATPKTIIEFIEFIEVQRRERSILAAMGVDHAGLLLGVLEAVLKRWVDEPSAELLAELTSGLPGLHTYDENLEIWELSRLARRDPVVSSALTTGSLDDLDNTAAGRRFIAAVDAFRARRPHRGTSDRDLMQPRWGDSREQLLEQLRAIVRLDGHDDPAGAHTRAAAQRRAATQRVVKRIRAQRLGLPRLMAFRYLLSLTQTYWTFRDNQRHSFDQYFYNLRNAYRGLGRRLVERGVLSDIDEVFFLSKDEVYDLIDGRLPASEGTYRAAWRRGWWNRYAQEEPPRYLKGDAEWLPEAPAVSQQDGLRGVGGSAGIATARARVVSNLRGLSELKSGEILVAQAIDPAWTPVFGMLKGVITEEGGMLSHVTVLAREYGIPAVIGVEGATRSIKTGDMVTLDGARGRIAIQVPEEEKA